MRGGRASVDNPRTNLLGGAPQSTAAWTERLPIGVLGSRGGGGARGGSSACELARINSTELGPTY